MKQATQAGYLALLGYMAVFTAIAFSVGVGIVHQQGICRDAAGAFTFAAVLGVLTLIGLQLWRDRTFW